MPKTKNALYLIIIALSLSFSKRDHDPEVLLEDNFSQLPSGTLSSKEGAHTEYHFIPELIPRGNWQVSSFYHDMM